MPMTIKARSSDDEKHSLDITSMVFHHGFLYSGSDDGKIMRWDEHLKRDKDLQAHGSSVYSMAVIENTIYSCSNDGTVKAWDLDLTPRGTIIKDDCEFWKLAVHHHDLLVGDDVGTVRIFKHNECVHRYETLEGVKELFVHDNLLYTGKDLDVTISVMDDGPHHNFTTRKSIPGRAPFCIVGDKLAMTARSAKEILVFDNHMASNFEELAQVKDAHDMIINALVGQKRGEDVFLYSGGWDKKLKEWKFCGTYCKPGETLDVQMVINTLIVRDFGVIYAGGSDGHIIKIQM